MKERDFAFIRDLVKDRCAVALDPDKQYLVETRLMPIVRSLKLGSLDELLRQLRAEAPSGPLHTRVLDAMMTTETLFFRDRHPFDSLRKVVLPELIKRRRSERSLSIWSAACSTGQEPYSLAILLREYFPEIGGWDLTLLATDVSRDVLARAAEGRFTPLEVKRGMPGTLLAKYFDQRETVWHLRPDVRRMVTFQELNLALPWPSLPRFDVVLLRNVMIYFDVETKKEILSRVARLLQPDGYLLLGGAETTINLVDSFRRVPQLKSGFYQLATSEVAGARAPTT